MGNGGWMALVVQCYVLAQWAMTSEAVWPSAMLCTSTILRFSASKQPLILQFYVEKWNLFLLYFLFTSSIGHGQIWSKVYLLIYKYSKVGYALVRSQPLVVDHIVFLSI